MGASSRARRISRFYSPSAPRQAIDISDAVFTLDYLFLGGDAPPCEDAAGANDDGVLEISDPMAALGALFLGGSRLPPPSRSPGVDPTADELSCRSPHPMDDGKGR